MDCQFLTTFPGFLHHAGVTHITHLLDDIEFAHPVLPLGFGFQCFDFIAVHGVDIFNITQPVIDQPDALFVHCRIDAAATIMAADDNMFHFQNINRVLQH